MKKGKKNMAIVLAFSFGYRATSDGEIISPRGKKLKLDTNKLGYKRFGIRYGRQTISISVHRFVAFQKYGEIIFNSDCVRHLDGDAKNNSFDNIEIGTYQENSLDIPKEARVATAKYASSFITIYDDKTVKSIKQYHSQTKSYKKTMEKFGISSKGTLYNILNNR